MSEKSEAVAEKTAEKTVEKTAEKAEDASYYKEVLALNSALAKRNDATVSTWHADEQGIQIKRVDGSLVHIRKGTIVSVYYYRGLERRQYILRATDFANSGRQYRGHPIGFLVDVWENEKWKTAYDAVLGLYPGSQSHQIIYVDVDTIRICEDPAGSPSVPLYSPPPEDPWSRGRFLLYALRGRDEAEAMRLLDAGVDLRVVESSSENNALHMACQQRMKSVMVRLILEGVPVLKNRWGVLPKSLLCSEDLKEAYTKARREYKASLLPPPASPAPPALVAAAAPLPKTGAEATVWVKTEGSSIPVTIFNSGLPQAIRTLLGEYPVCYTEVGGGRYRLEIHRKRLRELCERIGRPIDATEVWERLSPELSKLCSLEPGGFRIH